MSHKFIAQIKKVDNLDATYIEIPFDIEQVFGAKRVKVKAYFDGYEYRGSIVKMGLPCYMLGLTKAVRSAIGKGIGDMVEVEVMKDEDERIVEMPSDFMNQIETNKKALAFYEALSYSAKRKYFDWITGSKKEETRILRIGQAITKLENGEKIL